MGETPEEIRHDIEQTRARMTETVEAIGYRADVKTRAKEAVVDKKDTLVEKAQGAVSRVTGAMPDVGDAASSVGDAASSAASARLSAFCPRTSACQLQIGPVPGRNEPCRHWDDLGGAVALPG